MYIQQIMNDDKFSNAGKEFRNQQARDFSARDQSLARLRDIQIMCEKGVAAFYSAAELGRPDVYVERPTEQRLQIAYGLRPGPTQDAIVKGPVATVAVMPDGTTFLASDLSWTDPADRSFTVKTSVVPAGEWEGAFSDWLVDFLTKSERLYLVLRD
jgi:hypothetical protein